eukprot:TRINITY_DN21197_c0_g1_i3.p1 TRINITY_DN21197_c0_g1~~TRINITY_DN21197_c0_g1_i3.p1  ORF type:complete len:147 (+),score=20.16 TRINITY_DN21197_c0_g1_i3:93-533(+)
MELLQIVHPAQDWPQDSECEDACFAAGTRTGGARIVTSDSNDLWSESERSEVSESPTCGESVTTAMTMDNSDDKSDPGMNIFDLNAACWKRWEKFATEQQPLVNRTSSQSLSTDGSISTTTDKGEDKSNLGIYACDPYVNSTVSLL